MLYTQTIQIVDNTLSYEFVLYLFVLVLNIYNVYTECLTAISRFLLFFFINREIMGEHSAYKNQHDVHNKIVSKNTLKFQIIFVVA